MVIEFAAVTNLMRSLAEPKVLKSAALAALASSLACYPRLALWSDRLFPIWYVEAVILLGSFVLWAFAFAWHTQYTKQPVFALNLAPAPWISVTATGMLAAFVLHQFVDPTARMGTPEEYPANRLEWLAKTLFILGFTQLLLVFAPFDWSIRLFKRRWLAILFTVLFGVFVVMIKTRSSPTTVAPAMFFMAIGVRAVTTLLSVWFYSRYGVVLVWWWGFLLQIRHLLDPAGGR